ncbi:UDP-N-acetylmuramoyl-tripeptide--D-alanyl-D-alanine ligase, partial [Candidatus Gribaldobacteria bacterium]|nr:UDP-N-acetylmuramoyl-tripeptide--D-alanyl-D-alanine ligase [Candidatus Gribaldobacteria bacterium]
MVSSIFKLFLFCFVILFIERVLFWLYLWQLKNYHLKRFLAHFTTYQGKRLIFNLQNLVLFLGIAWLAFASFLKNADLFLNFYILGIFVLNILLALLCLKVLIGFVLLKIKRPLLTKKSGFLIISCFFFGFLITLPFLAFQEASIPVLTLILFLEPIFISLIVLALEPITVWQRKKILKKAEEKREKLTNLKVIALTGSYGKSSTKEYLYLLLKEKFGGNCVVKTENNINAEIGVAQTILNKVNEQTKYFIAEVGAYEKGKIKEVCQIIKPNISILTGINNQHLATFGSQDNIIQAKFEIIERLESGGVAIFNADNQLVRKKLENLKVTKSTPRGVDLVTCSTKQEADIMAIDIKVEKERLYFKALDKSGDSAQFDLRAITKPTIENILLALAVAKELGITLEESSKILQGKNLAKSIQFFQQKGIDLLLTDYSANLTGVLADLDHLSLWQGKKIVIMPCLIELGKTAKQSHQEIGKKISQVCDLAVITTKDYFKDLKKGIDLNKGNKTQIIFEQNPLKIRQKI